MTDFHCHETLPHIGPQGSYLSICYFHQDLYWGKLNQLFRDDFRATLTTNNLLGKVSLKFLFTPFPGDYKVKLV